LCETAPDTFSPPQLVALGDPVRAQDTTFENLPEVGDLAVGMVLRVDQELVLVVAIDSVHLRITVQRGVDGTVAAAHGINAGLFLGTDQRGIKRPVSSTGTAVCDIGAFEL
jgi:hypothetical protein